MQNVNSNKITAYLLMMLLLLSGCTVKYVAEYDASIQEETVQIAKKVDLFWGILLDTAVADRKYDDFKDAYNEIETDIRGLLMKNQIRALNKESTAQVQTLLDLWIGDKNLHKSNDSFSDFEANRHRKQFVRVFIAIAKGEKAKDNSSVSDTE